MYVRTCNSPKGTTSIRTTAAAWQESSAAFVSVRDLTMQGNTTEATHEHVCLYMACWVGIWQIYGAWVTYLISYECLHSNSCGCSIVERMLHQ